MMPSAVKKKRSIVLKLIVWLFLLSSLLLVSGGFLLKKGITLPSFSISNISVSELSLQWQEKLELSVESLMISRKKEKQARDKNSFSGKNLITVFKIGKVFSKVSINELQFGSLKGAIYFDQTDKEKPGYFSIQSNDLSLHSSLALDGDTLVLGITNFTAEQFRAKASGSIRVDTQKDTISGTLTADIANSFPVVVTFTADRTQLAFEGKENGRITTITPLVDLFGLSPDIQRWITDYLYGTRYTLKTFHGSIPWTDPLAILETLYAEVRVDDCEYTFAPGLEAIKTAYTDVTFQNGVLTIIPHESTFYGQDGGKSWLDINFSKPSAIVLTAHIITQAQANDDIINLLRYYHIHLPFRQTGGITDTDLTLVINLNEILIAAKGVFTIEHGEIEEDKKHYLVNNAKISLINNTVTFEHATLGVASLFSADIFGTVDAAKGSGELDITLQQLSIKAGKSTLQLDDTEKKPSIQYHIRPGNNSVDISKSFWKLDETRLNFGAFSTPFSYGEFSGSLPPTLLNLPIGISATISGPFSLKTKEIKLQCELLHYNLKDLKLEKPAIPIAIIYKDKLTVQHRETSHWKINNIETTVSPFEATYEKNMLTTKQATITYGDFFDSEVSGKYDLSSHRGEYFLDNLHIKNKDIGNLLNTRSSIAVKVTNKDNRLLLNVPDLALTISTGEHNSWSAEFSDLSTISQHSKMLQRFKLDNGSLLISSENGKKPYTFLLHCDYHYPFLVHNNTPMNHYTIAGEINDEVVTASVNENLHIEYSKQLTITSQDIAYNLPAILDFMTGLPKNEPRDAKQDNLFPIRFDAENSSIYLNAERQLLADRLHFDNKDAIPSLTLSHGDGHIRAEITGDKFSLAGEQLNADFMDAIIPGADFQGGQMSAAAQGTFTDYSALVKIENTNLKKFRTMHNILAFLDTIPALITFSLPEYDTRGLPITSAIVGFACENGKANMESITIQSPEFDIAGKGWLNFHEKTIDIDLNMITRAGANISQIPLAGFILAGDEKRPSVTLKISGDLTNPDVTNSMFQEISTMPFAILFRTLTLPVHLIKSMTGSEVEEKSMRTESTGQYE